jgi:hypothetical protein
MDNILNKKNNNNEKISSQSNFSNLPRVKTNGKSGAFYKKIEA